MQPDIPTAPYSATPPRFTEPAFRNVLDYVNVGKTGVYLALNPRYIFFLALENISKTPSTLCGKDVMEYK
ncbi:hypothetical protein JTB14_006297 [Gonioctena quinquepunctata]|nr:hypothetical protein JTB14_006297 [Gonioctena quinquepunctata]